MDWMQFISALVAALAWPGALVWIIFLLKRPILAAIPKIRSFKYGELHIDLTEELKSLQEDLPIAPPDPAPAAEPQKVKPSIPVQLAAVSPRAGVITAWLEVEKTLDKVIERNQLQSGTVLGRVPPPKRSFELLRERHFINRNVYEIGVKALRLRNEAMHRHDQEVSFEDALAMAEVCEWLTEQLESA
ncbi:hypothetical protein [Pseudomonas gingeri]